MHAVSILEGRLCDHWTDGKKAKDEELTREGRWSTKPEVVARSMLISTMVLFGSKLMSGYSRMSILRYFEAELMEGYPGLTKPPKLFDQGGVEE